MKKQCCECEATEDIVQLRDKSWWCLKCLGESVKWLKYLEDKEKWD